MQVNMYEAKSRLSELTERALKGETIVIAKAGKPLVNLVPYQSNKKRRVPGVLKGKIQIADDFTETDKEIIDAFEGDIIE